MSYGYRLIPIFVTLISSMWFSPALAQSSTQRDAQQQQAIGGTNPLMPKRMQVGFSGSGSATFMPRNYNGSMAGPTPQPNCTPTVTQVGFNIQCLSDPETKSASTCRGSLSFFGFNETRNVAGQIMALPGDVYSLKLNSPDDDIQGCELSNVPPVSTTLGNVITMTACGLNVAGCAGDAVGAGGNHALTSSGSVVLTPSD